MATKRTSLKRALMNSTPTRKATARGIAWWLYLLIAVGGYVFFKYFFADLAGSDGDKSLSEAGQLAAPIFAIVFLLLAANALYRDKPGDEQNDDREDKSRQE